MVVGGGNELNLACDLAVAADDIVFRQVGPSRGSLPSGGATQWLPLTIGDRRAREMLFLNRPISAQKALEWGLVNRCVPRAQLDMAVDDLCDELLAKMPETIRATKAQLDFWKDLSWGLTIRQAREWLTIHAASAEVRRASRASARSACPTTRLARVGGFRQGPGRPAPGLPCAPPPSRTGTSARPAGLRSWRLAREAPRDERRRRRPHRVPGAPR